MIVSDETIREYLGVMRRLGLPDKRIELLQERLKKRETVTHVNLGPRPIASRDPDDNIVIATAIAGRAQFLVTNDLDLLEIESEVKRKFPFLIVTPSELLKRLG